MSCSIAPFPLQLSRGQECRAQTGRARSVTELDSNLFPEPQIKRPSSRMRWIDYLHMPTEHDGPKQTIHTALLEAR